MCLNNDSSIWFDILQAVVALVAIPATLVTLYKLVKRDKKRESEVKSLSVIAEQLTDMQVETEKRYKASKKPHILIEKSVPSNKKLTLDLTNSNLHSSIVLFNVVVDHREFNKLGIASSTIVSNEGKQSFSIFIDVLADQLEPTRLKIDYITEEGYTFIQDIVIWIARNDYQISPSAIIDIKNSHNQ